MPSRYRGTPSERRALDLFIKVMRGSESFFHRLGVALDGTGLSMLQFGVLETLYHLGPLMPSQLAEKHLKSRNNLTVVIDHLEQKGYVLRKACPKDRRVSWIHLTPSGADKVKEIFPKFVEQAVREVSVLSEGEQEELARMMKRLGLGADARSKVAMGDPQG